MFGLFGSKKKKQAQSQVQINGSVMGNVTTGNVQGNITSVVNNGNGNQQVNVQQQYSEEN